MLSDKDISLPIALREMAGDIAPLSSNSPVWRERRLLLVRAATELERLYGAVQHADH